MTGSSAQIVGFGRSDRDAIVDSMYMAALNDYLSPELPKMYAGDPIPYCHRCNNDHLIGASCVNYVPESVMKAVRPGDTVNQTLKSQGLICAECESPRCMGKFPDEDCEESSEHSGSWRNYVRDPRRHLMLV